MGVDCFPLEEQRFITENTFYSLAGNPNNSENLQSTKMSLDTTKFLDSKRCVEEQSETIAAEMSSPVSENELVIDYPSTEDEVAKDSDANIDNKESNPVNVEEHMLFKEIEPAQISRSLRSTVKITYKQSNELEVQDKSVKTVNSKITEEILDFITVPNKKHKMIQETKSNITDFVPYQEPEGIVSSNTETSLEIATDSISSAIDQAVHAYNDKLYGKKSKKTHKFKQKYSHKLLMKPEEKVDDAQLMEGETHKSNKETSANPSNLITEIIEKNTGITQDFPPCKPHKKSKKANSHGRSLKTVSKDFENTLSYQNSLVDETDSTIPSKVCTSKYLSIKDVTEPKDLNPSTGITIPNNSPCKELPPAVTNPILENMFQVAMEIDQIHLLSPSVENNEHLKVTVESKSTEMLSEPLDKDKKIEFQKSSKIKHSKRSKTPKCHISRAVKQDQLHSELEQRNLEATHLPTLNPASSLKKIDGISIEQNFISQINIPPKISLIIKGLNNKDTSTHQVVEKINNVKPETDKKLNKKEDIYELKDSNLSNHELIPTSTYYNVQKNYKGSKLVVEHLDNSDMKTCFDSNLLKLSHSIEKDPFKFDSSSIEVEKISPLNKSGTYESLEDSSPTRKRRNSKSKVLENTISDQSSIVEDEKLLSKKKKGFKRWESNTEYKSTYESDDIIPTRKSRLAKTKALENIKILDSKSEDLVKENNITSEANQLKNSELISKSSTETLPSIDSANKEKQSITEKIKILPLEYSNMEMLENVPLKNFILSETYCKDLEFTVVPKETSDKTETVDTDDSGKTTELVDVNAAEKAMIFKSDSNKKKRNKKHKEAKSDTLPLESKKTKETIDGTNSTQIHDSFVNEVEMEKTISPKIVSSEVKVCEPDVEEEKIAKEVCPSIDRGEVTYTRKSRAAKSKALENINDLKEKSDILEWNIDNKIQEKPERVIKKTKPSKSENLNKTETNITEIRTPNELTILNSKLQVKDKIIQSDKLDNLNKFQDNTVLVAKVIEGPDCYDINKIDEDDNMDTEPFCLNKLKRNMKSKISHDEKCEMVAINDNAESEQTKNIDSNPSVEENIFKKNKTAKSKANEHLHISVPQDAYIDSEQTSSLDNTLQTAVVELNSILRDDTKIKPHKVKRNKNELENYCGIDQLSEISNSEKPSRLTKSKEQEIDKEIFIQPKIAAEKVQIQELTSEKKNGENVQSSNDKSSKTDSEVLDEPENKRRSRRACKVNTYNENDLAEAIFLQAAAEKKKEKLRKKKLDENALESVSGNNDKRQMNSEELFDLLKAAATENIDIPKPIMVPDPSTILSNDLTNDNFDNVFDDILEKSEALFSEREAHNASRTQTEGDTTQKVTEDCRIESEFDSNVTNNTEELQNSEDTYCNICKKSFKRTENLLKHKTTLTHISKLSEIEAKQAETKLSETSVERNEDSSRYDFPDDDGIKTNKSDSFYTYPSNTREDALNLAEIITKAFHKPTYNSSRNFSQIAPQVSEYRRYKSLGERKSFELDQGSSNMSDDLDNNQYEPQIANNAGVILEKQISLLQNIIENRGLSYIDDISVSSYCSLGNSNNPVSPASMSSKLEDSSNLIFPQIKSVPENITNTDNFLKPPQIEDISQDSINIKNGEDIKSRKVLNRDEELFLECCSLLKSGSEVSNFSKKSNRTVLKNITLKTSDEPDVFESKNLIEKVIEESSDYSRLPTPLGDSFGDTSNSNTISSNWKSSKEEHTDVKENNYFTFDDADHSEDGSSDSQLSKTISNPFKNGSKVIKNRKDTSDEDDLGIEESNLTSDCSSKMPTKGALKGFEGLKVSIPTEELNLEEVLNSSPPIKKTESGNFEDIRTTKEFLSPKTPRSARKSKPVKNKQRVDDRFIFKVKKKSAHKDGEKSKAESTEEQGKIPDVYDFEETQDNTDVFAKPDFKTFRAKGVDLSRNENIFENNYEGQTLSSSSSSTISVVKKPKTNECITKKKHMIMGRIFKNALKPKIDGDIKDIPIMDHSELVENYVLNCSTKGDETFKKPKMTEEEMNYLFDKLIDNPIESSKKLSSQNKSDCKNSGMKRRLKMKYKKRQRSNSDSTDDEFGLNKIVKKRPNRKNAKEEDNSINLEQELKECIGVASRKSQRKCTSGKQNVLVEYWSSDESAFETYLENHLKELSEKSEIPLPKDGDKCESGHDVVRESEKEVSKDLLDDKEKKIKSKPKTSSSSVKRKNISKESTSSAECSESSVQHNRRKRTAAHPLYHWSSSSEDEMQDLIEVKSIRDDPEDEDDEDRPIQHGWIVGDSPKKLVTMLAQAKGKKTEPESSVKEQGKKKNFNS